MTSITGRWRLFLLIGTVGLCLSVAAGPSSLPYRQLEQWDRAERFLDDQANLYHRLYTEAAEEEKLLEAYADKTQDQKTQIEKLEQKKRMFGDLERTYGQVLRGVRPQRQELEQQRWRQAFDGTADALLETNQLIHHATFKEISDLGYIRLIEIQGDEGIWRVNPEKIVALRPAAASQPTTQAGRSLP